MTSLLLSKKTTYIKLSVFFIICFSFYWATNVMSISPIYFTTMMGGITFIFSLYYKPIPNERIFVYLWHFIYSMWFLINSVILGTNSHQAMVSAFFALFYIFADIVLYQINEKRIFNKFLYLYIILFVLYYLVDGYMRFQNSRRIQIPSWIQANPKLMFYMYKEGGLNADSNQLGCFCCVFYALLYFCRKVGIVNKKLVILAFVLTFLTFSRAAIISCLVLLLLDKFFFNVRPSIRLFMCFLTIMGIYILFEFFSNDTSFQSKIDIFQKTYKYASDCSLFEFLFGVGPLGSISVLNIYAHNIWSTIFIEYGFIHLIIFVFMMFITFFDIGRHAIYIYIVFFLVSLSYTTTFLQFLFVGLVLTKHISRLYGVKEVIKNKKRSYV